MDRFQLVRSRSVAARVRSLLQRTHTSGGLFLRRGLITAFAIFMLAMAPGIASAACNSPSGKPGEIETFPADRIMRYCNGSSWVDMGEAGSPPAGSTTPKILDIHTGMGQASDIKKIGNYIYYTDYSGRAFGVIDVSTPTDPHLIGHMQDMVNLQTAVAFDISGNYAYVITYDAPTEITVIDISDPTDPTIVATADLAAGNTKAGRYTNFNSIAISGHYAYLTTQIASSARGITVVDISTPTAPVQVATLNNPTVMNGPLGIAVSGNYAYVASSVSDSLAVIDISTPTAPSVTGSITNAGLDAASMVAVDGTDVFVVTNTGHRLNIIDASDPAAPTSRAVFDLLSLGALDGLNSNGESVGKISLNGDHLYVGAYRTLAVVDVSDRDNPAGKGFLHYDANANNGGIAIIADGGYVYQINNGITVHDVSNPAVPAYAIAYWFAYGNRFHDQGVGNRASQVYDNRVYFTEQITGNHNRVHVVDYTDPLNPVLRGNVTIPSAFDTRSMDYDDGYLYYAGGWGASLAILDVRDADNPAVVKRMNAADISAGYGATEQVIVDYPYAYLLGRNVKRIVAMDISNPASPTTLGTFTDANFTGNQKMAKVENYLYVRSASSQTLTVVDVSNPAAMTKRGVLSGITDISANAPIYADESRREVYLAAGIGGSNFQIIDASNPDNPAVKTGIASPGSPCSGLRLKDAVFALRYDNLQLFNAATGAAISALTDPAFRLSGCGDWKSLAGKYFVTNAARGIVILDPGLDYGSDGDAARCTGPDGQLGTTHYSYAFRAIRMCNGTRWVNLGPAGVGGGGGCSGPSKEGASRLNSVSKKYEFCDGANWIEFN